MPVDESGSRHDAEQVDYMLFVQRHHNEDRTLAERTNFFLLGNAFLFAGFAALDTKSPNVDIVRLAIPSIGICLTLLGAYLNYMSIRALDYFRNTLRSMRNTHEAFLNTRMHGLDPYLETAPEVLRKSKVLHFNSVFIFWIPVLMLTLWSISLAWIAVSWGDPG